MEKRFWKMAAVIMLAAVMLTACGKTVEEKENTVAADARESAQKDEPEKTVLTYGTIVMDPEIQKIINRINKLEPDYEIVVKDYGKDAASDEEAVTNLNFDILNGTGPDILVLPVYYSMDLYAERGILEDLYTYIDSDEELTREDFLPNILKAYETDGKLYGIPVSFDIDTLVGAGSMLGNRTSWTLDEMIAFTEQFEPGTDIFENSSQSSVMKICMKANWNQFVSWGQESFTFDRELYKKILEFSNRFPKDEEYVVNRKYQQRIEEGDMALLIGNLLLLNGSVDIYHVFQDQLYSSLFKEPVTYIGYPAEAGNGSLAWSMTTLSMNSSSKNKEAAWNFLRQLLSEEYYENTSFFRGFSIRKDVLEQQLQLGSEEWLPPASLGEDFTLEIKEVQKEEAERIRSLIESIDTRESVDYTITNIMVEEAQAYFNGIKSAEEVADIAESRIKMYVNEMK